MTGLSLRRNPVGLVFSRGLRASAWYLFSYLFTWTVFLAVVVCASLIAWTLSLTIAGLPLLAVAAGVIRWCADAERARLRIMSADPVRGRYRAVTGRAWLARLKSRWTDPALWRDLAYLSALSPLLLALDFAALGAWLASLAGITAPAWYATVRGGCIGYCGGTARVGIQFGSFPHGPHGPGASGFAVDTLPSSVILAAVCLVTFLLFSYVVVAAARLHAAIARSVLRPPEAPLREAREVLRRPVHIRPPGQRSAPDDPD
jgi:hypothetical protein